MGKWKLKDILLYILIVLVPSILGSIYLIYWQNERQTAIAKEETAMFAHIHKNDIDRFIAETITRLETLAFIIGGNLPMKHKQMESILNGLLDDDQRFDRLSFLADEREVNGSKYWIKLARQTKQTVVSKAHKENDKILTTIVTPIIDLSSEQVSGFLIADVRLDYIKNIIKVVNPHISFCLYDSDRSILFATKQKRNEKIETISVHLNNVPWKIEAYVPPLDKKQLLLSSIHWILLIVVVTHIIFLLIKYWLLKRATMYERIQNEAQKLELVGTLAASTAHEIRNPLAGIKGFIQLLSEKHKDQESQLYFSVIEKEIARINQIVSEFLVLGKPTAQKLERCDLREIVTELHPIIESQAHLHNVLYTLDFPSIPLPIFCSKDHLKQVILNLAKNALESMPKNGWLTISLSKEKTWAKLQVKDTGCGIPKEMLDKIFQPFFTLKETGTGLGLVVCKRIIEMYDGKITIDSVVNKGTTVTVLLPLQREERVDTRE
ncbi:two-component system, sporulation sensor kinase D [Thermolongibacillus altinsuensis]|uniref:histidine kinase n=1 Tax=Thermolongibacillus altinsuensis TaxID=575256 RepID=A0A4R1QDD0_9BACL|nr:PAS domain-containing sensor histidine kinase [Thermolongibacillus altinsuensis]TCL49252.1 two-component system, sporulation sensor kinase D [Thermolongibacillus altinsuensis]